MRLDGVALTGALIATFAYSARAAYEELDQDVPHVKWPLAVLEAVGYGVVAYALVSGPGLASWGLPVAAAALLSLGVALQAMRQGGEWMVMALQTAGYVALGAGLALRGAPLAAAAGCATLVLVHTMLLPAETERRITHGPGMSLLVIGWGIVAYAALASAGTTASVSTAGSGPLPSGSPAVSGPLPSGPPSVRTFLFPQSTLPPGSSSPASGAPPAPGPASRPGERPAGM